MDIMLYSFRDFLDLLVGMLELVSDTYHFVESRVEARVSPFGENLV